ncbi:MAG TPA: hypothetical protein VF461_14810 [Gemmatimonadaceae bacterium]
MIWHLDVDRVRIVGAGVQGLDAAELRLLVERAVHSAVEALPLPNGRTAHASVEVQVSSLSGPSAISSAVARGITQAVRGGGRAHG